MKLCLASIFSVVIATSASAATTGTWHFSLEGDGYGGFVRFSGTDQNNDGFLRTADGEVADLLGRYDNGGLGSPSYAGVYFDETYARLSYRIDGVFGDNSNDFISYSNSFIKACPAYECGFDQDGNLYEYISYSDFYFAGQYVSASGGDEIRQKFSLSANIGPQIVTGPISDVSAVPLPASSLALLSGFLGFLLFRKKKYSLQPL